MRVRRRREGFRGQHHCVLPPAVVNAATENPLLRGLIPTDAGMYPRAAGHYVQRREGATGTVLLVCREGRGWVRWRRERADLAPGHIAFLAPNAPHTYASDDEDPWTIEWVHFAGTEAAAWRLRLGETAGGGSVQVPLLRLPEVNLAAIYQTFERGYGEVEMLEAAAALRSSLTQIVRWRSAPGAMTAADSVAAAAAWMREHLDEKITLEQAARRSCLSASHFSAMFRQRFGYAPIDWLIRQRIQLACSLLRSGPDKIEWIGRQVGIADPYYFSRLFRRVMGVSPREFRGGS